MTHETPPARTDAAHTPAPWKVRANPNGTLSIDAREPDGTACSPASVNGDATDVECGPVTWANARRIVACVNACEGMNPEAVPALLEACRKASALLASLDEDYAEVESDLYDAIRKAEGKAQ